MTNLLTRLLPRSAPPAPRSILAAETDRDSTHREIVAMALRDVMRKYGLPPTWITASPQSSTTARRARGIHLLLAVREWQPQVFPFMWAIERAVRARALRLDPFAGEWLTGVSWKLELVDDSRCPALPDPGFWSAYEAAAGAEALSAAAMPVAPVLVQTAPGPARAASRAEPDFLPTQPMPHPAQ